jgi:hypothetical protein
MSRRHASQNTTTRRAASPARSGSTLLQVRQLEAAVDEALDRQAAGEPGVDRVLGPAVKAS